MPLDQFRLSDTRAWLVYANEDLATAEDLLTLPRRHIRSIVFHSQQAAEKALKAFLTWHDRPFGRVHNLEELGQSCSDIDPTMGELVNRAVALSKYATRFRYPGARREPKAEEARVAAELAREVLSAVTGRLPAEARP